MAGKHKYEFTSERLGFRAWQEQDLQPMAMLNSDQDVMQYFPSIQSKEHTAGFINRMQEQFTSRGYCYYAVEKLDDQQFIGFVGICFQDYEAHFTPCIDIGWRLKKSAWGVGYATEGANACLSYAYNTLKIKELYAVASANNQPSINVMKKISMEYHSTFEHPALLDFPLLKTCVLYHIDLGK